MYRLSKSRPTQIIGPEEVADGIWSIHFNRVLLAGLDERDRVIRD
jgi:hypothetical protein